MSKKPRNKQQRPTQKAQRSTKGPKRRWTLGHLIAAFFLGAVLGFFIAYDPGDGDSPTDAFGRSPGDPHYMHSHR